MTSGPSQYSKICHDLFNHSEKIRILADELCEIHFEDFATADKSLSFLITLLTAEKNSIGDTLLLLQSLKNDKVPESAPTISL